MRHMSRFLATSAIAASVTAGLFLFPHLPATPRAAAQTVVEARGTASTHPLGHLQAAVSSTRRNDDTFDYVLHSQHDGALGRKTLMLSSILIPANGDRFSKHTITPDQEMDVRTITIFVNDHSATYYIFEELEGSVDPAAIRWIGRHSGPATSLAFAVDPPIRLRSGNSLFLQQSPNGGIGGYADIVLHGTTGPGVAMSDTLQVE